MLSQEALITLVLVGGAVYYSRQRGDKPQRQLMVGVGVLVVVIFAMQQFGFRSPIEMFKHPDAVWDASMTGDGQYKPYAAGADKEAEWRTMREFPVSGAPIRKNDI
jgi:hypothetical protein